jgi:tetratricopeptide (TPR) repeat protein
VLFAALFLAALSLATAAPPKPKPNQKVTSGSDDFYDTDTSGTTPPAGGGEAAIKKAQEDIAASESPTATPVQREAAQIDLESKTKAVSERADANPESLPIQNSAARFAMQVGDFPTAVKRAEQAVALAAAMGKPAAMDAAQTTRAAARYANKDFAGACSDATGLLEREPQSVTAFEIKRFSCGRNEKGTLVKDFDVKTLVAQQSPAAVVAHDLQQWSARRDTPARAQIARAMIQRKAHDLQGALRSAEAAVNVDGGDPMAYAQRGLARSDLKDYNGAILDLSKAIAMGMVWNPLYKMRAQALIKAKQNAAAAQDADLAILLDPKDGDAYAVRAMAKLGEGGVSTESILADLQEAARLDPASFTGLLEKAKKDLASGGAAATPANEGRPPRATGYATLPWWAQARSLAVGVGAILLLLVFAAVVLLRPREGAAGLAAAGGEGLIGGYIRLGKRIGAGGMGTVYEAWDTNLDRAVAVKRMNESLRDDPQEATRFIQEAKTVASLKHPNIVAIYDAFQDARDKELYLVFELVKGKTLDEQAESRGGKLPWPEVVQWLTPLCEALDFAHARGVIHRDLKPNNVMIEDGRVKVMDFGIARRTKNEDVRTMTSQLIGTPSFMAPEQLHGEVSKESDVYAVGVIAYNLLTGRLPFQGDALEAKLQGRFTPLAEVVPAAAGLDPVLARALHPDRKQRFHSAGELLQAFRDAVPA